MRCRQEFPHERRTHTLGVSQCFPVTIRGKGDAVRMASKYFSRKYFDPVKIDEVNAGSIKAYMVDRGAMALANRC